MTEPLLEVRDLIVDYPGRRRGDSRVRAVDHVSLHVSTGETLGLVGESGSGKSTIGNAILGLVAPTGGSVLFEGRDITQASARQRRELSGHIQVIFQDPYGSLNPSRTIGHTLTEPLRVVHGLRRAAAESRVADGLARVGMPPDTVRRYPAEFSGGQRQRIAIARAIIHQPQIIVCDEPTSALDLSIQAQILNLLLDLQQQLHLSYLLISHDIDVVRHMSHRTAVLLKGGIVEQGPTVQVTGDPSHDYTRALLAAVPQASVPSGAQP
ncbi:ATP-binding cassette domain-containing protein [Jiangella sp. DSM 45060]|uniref:ATP-binding cassette domain-containing protein n=1 Tax=Jiangella sp. DSM 45060 TaxID=1798224 RepID=UPI00087BF35F|nr:ATP-binding cassette domain-containing protein [Jiangella sp. DSM 45060]SDT50768.1 ABC transporter [Jiangella sp. DSM 45060]